MGVFLEKLSQPLESATLAELLDQAAKIINQGFTMRASHFTVNPDQDPRYKKLFPDTTPGTATLEVLVWQVNRPSFDGRVSKNR